LVVVLALVVGVAAGAYGWDRWRDQEVETSARASVDVSSEVLIFGFEPELDKVTLSVRVRNDGPYPITLTAVTPVDPRLRLLTDEFKPVELSPAEDFVKVLNLGLDCDAAKDPDSAAEGETLDAHLRTVDGAEHQERLSMNGVGLGFPSGLTEQCTYVGQYGGFRDIFPEPTAVERVGLDAVSAVVLLHTNSDDQLERPEVVEVTAPTGAFEVRWEAVGELGAPTGHIMVTWSVLDCALALTADDRQMSVDLRGRMPADDGFSAITAYPSPTLIVELVRLAERVCT